MFGMGCMCWVLVQSFGRGLNTAYLLGMLGMGFMCCNIAPVAMCLNKWETHIGGKAQLEEHIAPRHVHQRTAAADGTSSFSA